MSDIQVDEDMELLALMVEDGESAPPVYRTTNYWELLGNKLMPELNRHGLKDFRRRRRSPLGSFAGVDLKPLPPHIDLFDYRLLNNRYTVRIPEYERWLERVGLAISRKFPLRSGNKSAAGSYQKIALDRAEHFGAKFGAKPLSTAGGSSVGNPEWEFEAFGNLYTIDFIVKYLTYAYASQFIDFAGVKVFIELGSGAGRQAELLHKFYPDMSILLFDIPPQLYVCEQYLKKVFPGEVINYRETRDYRSLPKPQPGKIYMFGNWQFPLLEGHHADLFWNSGSFPEMEPNVVANYLSYVNKVANTVFIQGALDGKHLAKRKGAGGVLAATTFDDYRKGLPGFEEVDGSPSIHALGQEGLSGLDRYCDSFWRSKKQ